MKGKPTEQGREAAARLAQRLATPGFPTPAELEAAQLAVRTRAAEALEQARRPAPEAQPQLDLHA